ncbi:hypothetical protein NA56DRAFT_711127 [Hyaloscypha hepaticicola]|uniref:SRR1-like domain-containing protein n=1 Tax=Hyaloscypha hepaticicola TaxID=2082293 RepID=A0A2J6PJS9_9HELO|nr:hypothetical protein NA56DRAFT_711127 [Hyaloscypha hepaticicola]
MARRKKPSTTTNYKKPTVIHTKRREIVDDEGWTHVIDAPNRKAKAETLKATPLLHGGDFIVNGVSYITRTLEAVKQEFEHWKKQWKACPACVELKSLLVEGAEKGERRKIRDVVFLGMGSLQNSRREGRRASATQLAALQMIIDVLDTKGMEVVLQDPQFTELDKEFLGGMGYRVVDDPDAFRSITEDSLVYAIHCYVNVYKAISEGPKPALLIGTDIENFGRFGSKETTEAAKKSLEEMVEGCEVLEFPQVRHDFSDTKIYWRRSTPETAKP